MLDDWRSRLARRRVRPGAGEPLPRFRWWHVFSRTLLRITLPGPDAASAEYAVDIRRGGDGRDGVVRARLYRDGALLSSSTVPARFDVPGGRIEVAVGTFGVKRARYVSAAGEETRLVPDPASAEGRRAELHRRHPGLSRVISVVSTLLVVVGLAITVPQILEAVSAAPFIADSIGTFRSPVQLPPAADVAVGLAVVAGSIERALRMRSSWLDDLAS